MTPQIPKNVTIDLDRKKLLIDGVEFPWMIADDPTVDSYSAQVTVRLVADEVTVLGIRPHADRPA